jgi:DNA repair protein RadD
MKITPREYQKEAIEAIFDWCKTHDADQSCYVEMPTGSGKSVVIAMFCETLAQLNKRVIVLCRQAELVQQNADRFQQLAGGKISVGIYCAGLDRKDIDCDVTFATIQSISGKAGELGRINAVLIDEAHQIPARSDSQYGEFINEIRRYNPMCRLVGLTATPYRLHGSSKSMLIDGEGQMFAGCAYAVSIKRMLSEGSITDWVVPGVTEVDVSNVRIKGNDYDLTEMSFEFSEKCEQNVAEIAELCKDRNKVLVFATTILHAEILTSTIAEYTCDHCMLLTGDTPSYERERILRSFNQGSLKYLVNVQVLTTGFDAPCVDAIAICRATQSPGLFYQIMGRGMRRCEGKDDFLVLDFGGNFERLGDPKEANFGRPERSVKRDTCPSCNDFVLQEDIRCPSCKHLLKTRICPNCKKDVAVDTKVCKERMDETNLFSDLCNFDFTKRRCWSMMPTGEQCTTIIEDHEDMCPTCTAIKERKMFGEFEATCAKVVKEPPKEFSVTAVDYRYHTTKDESKPPSMRVTYTIEPLDDDEKGDLSRRKVSEWICLEHQGYAREKAYKWWQERSAQSVPDDIHEAVYIATEGGLSQPSRITVQKDGKYDRIISYRGFDGYKDPVFLDDEAPF